MKRLAIGMGTLLAAAGVTTLTMGTVGFAQANDCTRSVNGVCTARGISDRFTRGMNGFLVAYGIASLAGGLWILIHGVRAENRDIRRIDRLLSRRLPNQGQLSVDFKASPRGGFASAKVTF